MSATRLLVLGVVRIHGQAHGYQVRRDLLSWSADSWAKVQPGSIYHALKKMTREGLVAEVATEGGAGPERTLYQLTDDGETEFMTLLTRSLSEPDREFESLNAAVTFLPTLKRETAIALLNLRITRLEGQAASAHQLVSADGMLGKPEHVGELFRLWEVTVDAAIRWTHDVIGRLQAGKYVMADDPARHFGQPVDL
jgi:DNA-binding PadR family transcriptional regulator